MIVSTPNGSLRGQEEHGVAVFRGIPYAKPPIGDLRFLAPVPAGPWDSDRDALAFGPTPPQSQAWGASEPSGDDWLTVNVWSPDTTGRLPVIVWAYGGAYRGGSASDPQYDGAVLANGGVVIVTANHRVGMEGYGLIDGAPANRGILDQIEVLRWVQANITSFGGDPDTVTVMGESAGAGSTAALLAIPEASGLFRRMILHSTPGFFFSPQLATAVSDTVTAHLGRACHRDDLATVSTAELESAVDAVAASLPQRTTWGRLTHLPTPLSPVVDGDTLPMTPFEALAAGASHDIDLLVAHTRDEARIFLAMAGKLGKVTSEEADAVIADIAPNPDAFAARHGDLSPELRLQAVLTDWMFRAPAERIAALHTAAGGSAYLAEFDWTPSGSAGVFGPTHATDLPLVFGNPPATMPGGAPYAADDRYATASAAVRNAWIGFATTGRPGWSDYSTGAAAFIRDGGIAMAPYADAHPTDLWEDESFDPLSLASLLSPLVAR